MHIVLVGVLLGWCMALTGCATSQLFDSKTSYEEETWGFGVSEDDSRLVLVGEDYHYVLDLPASLRPVFEASYQPLIQWDFGSVEVLKDQTMTLKYHAKFDGQLVSQQDKDAAIADGFMADERGRFRISGVLSGRREDGVALPAKMILPLSKHPREFSSGINVTEERTTTKQVFRMALVPVALVLDGAVVVTAIPYAASIFGAGNFWRALARVVGASVANSGFIFLTGGHPPRFQ